MNLDVIPLIAYEDGITAIKWLAEAFGFKERTKIVSDEGILIHGEMEAGNGIIMLATPTPEYESPDHHQQHCDQTAKWLAVPWVVDGVLVYVDDLQQHFEQTKAYGAEILSVIETDAPGPRYRVKDVEGHRWFFFQREETG